MKKNLNNFLLIFTLACWCFSMLGCSKEFLDRKPLTATLSDLEQGGLQGQVFGLYGAIRDFDNGNGNGFSSIPWLAIHGFRDGDSKLGSAPSDGTDWRPFYEQFQYSKDHWSIQQYWYDHYGFIGSCNLALQYADSLKLSDPASLVNVAEAKFFRAHAYFDLVRAFGQVPLINFVIYSQVQGQIAKTSEANIYKQIDDDLNFAIANLPANWLNSSGNAIYPGRLTKYAAMALSAKTLLYRQNWGAAYSLLTTIINSGAYSLTPNFADAFSAKNKNNAESIFEYQAYEGAGGYGGPNSYPARIQECQGFRGSGEWDLGWGWNVPRDVLNNAFDPLDPRKSATILYSGKADRYGKLVPDTPTAVQPFWNNKYYPDPELIALTGDRHGLWTNQKVIRYSDVLLMAAEAANELGTNDKSVEYLEVVRARARTSGSSPSPSALPKVSFVSQTQMRSAIQSERRFEFAMEGERFYDLVRWGLASSVLGPLGYQDKNKYLPLPQLAVDQSNGKLVQNPDYTN